MSDKKFSPREAALAVLKKAEELYKESTLAKAEQPLAKKYEGFKAVEASAAKSGASDPAAVAAAVGREKYGKEAFQHAAAAGKKMRKSDEEGANPDEKADAELGEKVEQEVQAHEEKNADPEHHEKGSYKLAKFMGKMEMKKGEKGSQMSGKTGSLAVAETGHEKGINTKGNHGASQGISQPGAAVRNAATSMPKQAAASMDSAKDQHKQVLDQIHHMSKPKLPE